MRITFEQIVEETREWPREQLAELVDRLILTLHGSTQESTHAWKSEVRRRVREIESGRVRGSSGAEVSARVGRIVGR
jgi:Putative addiction module component